MVSKKIKQKERPEKTIMRFDDDGIIEFGTRKKVTISGNGGAVNVPKALVGKYVEVYYLKEKKEKKK